MSARTIVFLEFFRVYAVTAVLISHKFPQLAHIQLNDADPLERLIEFVCNAFLPILTNGQAGVVVFFLVSGFIIAQKVESETFAEFCIKRIFRIYPLYIAAVLLFDIYYNRHLSSWSQLWPKFTLLGDFTGVDFGVVVEWTLRIEVEFYILASLLTLVPKFKSRDLVLIVLVNAAAVACVLMPQFPNWSPDTSGHFNQFFPFLMVGFGFYLFDQKRASFVSIAPVTLIAIAGFGAWNWTLFVTFSFFAVMIMKEKWQGHIWIARLSCITYGMYLFHFTTFDYFMQALAKSGVYGPVAEIVSLGGLIVVCYSLHFIVERPLIKVGRVVARLAAGAAVALRRITSGVSASISEPGLHPAAASDGTRFSPAADYSLVDLSGPQVSVKHI